MALTYTETEWNAREVAKAEELFNLTNECNARVAAAEKDRDEKVKAAQKTSEDYCADLNAVIAERDALRDTVARFLAADDATKAAMLAEAVKSERQKALEAAQAKLAAAQAEIAALAD